jgi:putative transposase
MKVRKTFRIYPTDEQAVTLAKTFGCVRFVYNKMLDFKVKSYEKGIKINYSKSSAILTEWKKEIEWLNEVSSVTLQQSLRHLEVAYKNFFRKTSGFPKFKSKWAKQSAHFTASGFKICGNKLFLAKLGLVKVVWSQELNSASSVTITKDCAGRYFASFVTEESASPLPPVGKSIGLDMGLTSLVTMSNGIKVENPKFYTKNLKKLGELQKKLSRKVVGSNHYLRLRLKIGRLHARIKDSRKDYAHKLTTWIVRSYDTISIEDLAIQDLTSKNFLSRSILDSSWEMLSAFLQYKCQWYGRELKIVDQYFPSSKTCSFCGEKTTNLTLADRSWTCACGAVHDRDINAAKNIEAGHALGCCKALTGTPAL